MILKHHIIAFFLTSCFAIELASSQAISDSVLEAVRRAEKRMLPKSVLSKIKAYGSPYRPSEEVVVSKAKDVNFVSIEMMGEERANEEVKVEIKKKTVERVSTEASSEKKSSENLSRKEKERKIEKREVTENDTLQKQVREKSQESFKEIVSDSSSQMKIRVHGNVAPAQGPSSIELGELEDAVKAFSISDSLQSETRLIEPTPASFALSSYLVDLKLGMKDATEKTSLVSEYNEAMISDEQKLSLASPYASMRGIILGIEHLPTRVDLLIQKEKMSLSVPLLKREGLPSSKNATYVFLKLENIETVDLAASYEERIFYDSNFKASKIPSDYVLFTGVTPGNILIFSEKDKKYAEKVVAVSLGEVYYDELSIEDSYPMTFSLTQRNIFGDSTQDVNIEADRIRYFNTAIKSNKIGPGLYEIKRPHLLSNMRNYLDFGLMSKDLPLVLIGGLSYDLSLEIPSLDFMAGITKQFESFNTMDDCIVQINLKSAIKSFEFKTVSANKDMQEKAVFLSRTGEFSQNAGSGDKYIFIHGKEQGLISARIEYEKGPVDFFKTYCSPQIYLVEQI